MSNINIETDGDGDSAVVQLGDYYWFYEINGYGNAKEFYATYDGENYMGGYYD